MRQKTIIVADSQPKIALLMNWFSTAINSNYKRVRFSNVNGGDEQIIDYVDQITEGTEAEATRIIGIETRSLAEPLLIPILRNAGKLVFFISRNNIVEQNSLLKLASTHKTLLQCQPDVFCLFSSEAISQKMILNEAFVGIGIQPIYPDLHTNDFSQMWSSIFMAKPKVLAKMQATAPASSPLQQSETTRTVSEFTQAVIASTAPAIIATPAPPTATTAVPSINPGESNMSNITESLNALMQIEGAIGCFIADYSSGMLLAKAGTGMNLDIAAAGNTEVIKAKMKTMVALGLKDTIEDILITLGTQYHLMRPMPSKQGLFLYLALDKAKANLAMARFKLSDIEKTLAV